MKNNPGSIPRSARRALTPTKGLGTGLTEISSWAPASGGVWGFRVGGFGGVLGGFGVGELGFRVSLGFGVWGLGVGVWGFGFWGFGFKGYHREHKTI